MTDIVTLFLRLLNILFIPMFIWVVIVERRLMKIETILSFRKTERKEVEP